MLEDFNSGAVGDLECNSYTDNSVSNIGGKSPEFVFGLGDYSYQPTGTCWFNKIVPVDSITRISIGNHDYNSEGCSSYMSHLGLSQTYYSYDYQNVHILVLVTDRNIYSLVSAQYNFAVDDLHTTLKNPNVNWIIK